MTDSTAECVSYTERFTEYYRRLGFPCQVVDGTLWLEENRMIFPVRPASVSTVVPKGTARLLLSNSRRAILVKCTDGFRPGSAPTKWYAVICKSFVDLEQYDAKKRSQIRKGLRECVAKRVDAEYIATHGYHVYTSAFARYARGTNRSPVAEQRFRQDLLTAADFIDVVDYWAVLHRDVLVGYAKNHLYGSAEVAYSAMTFDPAYFKVYSAYALIYRMNEYYLHEKCVDYVNDGFRTLLHPTELQQLLIGKFGFERAYTNLFVYYKPYVSWIMSLPAGARRQMGRLSSRLAALNALHDARTTSCE
jgi:hypothetical protein